MDGGLKHHVFLEKFATIIHYVTFDFDLDDFWGDGTLCARLAGAGEA